MAKPFHLNISKYHISITIHIHHDKACCLVIQQIKMYFWKKTHGKANMWIHPSELHTNAYFLIN